MHDFNNCNSLADKTHNVQLKLIYNDRKHNIKL